MSPDVSEKVGSNSPVKRINNFQDLEKEYVLFNQKSGSKYSRTEYLRLQSHRLSDPMDDVDSGFTEESLPQELPKSTTDLNIGEDELGYLKRRIRQSLKLSFWDAEPLSKITAHKWIENFRIFYENFKNMQIIFTTKNYRRANFDGREIEWDFVTITGNSSIQKILEAAEEVIMGYFNKRKLIDCVKSSKRCKGSVSRAVWMKANKFVLSASRSPVKEYLNDALTYWTDIKENGLLKSLQSYNYQMTEKFGTRFFKFFETRGFAIPFMWSYWRQTSMASTFLKVIAEYYVLYLTDPLKIEMGSLGFEEYLFKSQTWRDASFKRRKAEKQIENLKKRRSDNEVSAHNAKKRCGAGRK